MTVRIANRYAERMPQLVTRVDSSLVEAIDQLVASGAYGNRSDVVRVAIERLVDRHRRDEIGRQIVEGYRRMPETDEEMAWAEASLQAMVEEEPW